MITVNSPNLLSPLDLCSSSMGTRDGRRACSPRTPHLYGGPITSSRPDPPLAQAQPSPRACSQSAVCPCEVHWQLPSSRCGRIPQRRPTGENPWRGRHERGAARTGQEMRASLYEARGGHAARAACEGHPHQGILTDERSAKTSRRGDTGEWRSCGSRADGPAKTTREAESMLTLTMRHAS